MEKKTQPWELAGYIVNEFALLESLLVRQANLEIEIKTERARINKTLGKYLADFAEENSQAKETTDGR